MMKACTIFLCLSLAAPLNAETVVALRLIRPMAAISEEDLGLSKATVANGFTSIEEIVGLEARATLYQGQPIRRDDVGPPVLVTRNQPVNLIYSQGGLRISTDARALSRGAEGEFVRVMNLSSRTTVTGVVQGDGSVVVRN